MFPSSLSNDGNNNSKNNFLIPQYELNAIGSVIAQEQLKYKISYSNPASIQTAQKHKKATKYGYMPPIKKGGNNRNLALLQRQQICGCCNLSSNNQPISIFHRIEPTKVQQVYKLTQDVALFFTFVKSVILFIILHTVIHSAFNIISSGSAGSYCDKTDGCQKQFWNKTSISNKYNRQDLVKVVDILDLVAILTSIVYLGWSRRYFYRISQNIDLHSVSQGDFTLLISRIPSIQYPTSRENMKNIQSSSRQKLQAFLQQIIITGISNNQIQSQADKLQSYMRKSVNSLETSKFITSLSLCYNLSQLQVLHNSKWNLIWSFQSNFILLDFCGFKLPDLIGFKNPASPQNIHNLDQPNNTLMPEDRDFTINDIRKRLQNNLNEEVNYNLISEEKKNELNQIRKKVEFLNESEIILINEYAKNRNLLFHNTNFSGNAFVSFQFEDFKQYLQFKYHQDPKLFIFQGSQLKIQDASDPTDVNWFNMKISQGTRTTKIIFSYIVLVMLLAFSFVILFSVELIKRGYAQSEKGGMINFARTQGLSLMTSLIVLGANSLIDFVTWFLTDLQAHTTKTNQMFSHMIKSFLSKIINTIMMYFMISIILTRDHEEQKFMSSMGLVTQIYNFIVVSGLVNLIHSFINKDDLWMRLKRWYIYYYRQNTDTVYTKFQISLNKEFELPEFNLVYKYSDYLVTLYTALFYAYLVPIGVPTICIIFVVQYWIDKFTLFKRSSLRNHFSFDLSIYVRRMFESSIFVFALGNLIFSYYLQNYTYSVINIIGLVLSLVFTICVWVSPRNIQRKLFGEYEVADIISFSQCVQQNRFKTTYWSQNPATFCVDQRIENSKIKRPDNSIRRSNK